MVEKYREYLASNVLGEGKVVSHRLLTYALNVHHLKAKQMLFDFHQRENKKKPGSVHATYWISGLHRNPTESQTQENTADIQDGEDTVMQSSPFPSSLPQAEEGDEEDEDEWPPMPSVVRTMLLVHEADLEAAKAQFETIDLIFIHTLAPGSLEDFAFISVCNREVATKHLPENPLEGHKIYGTPYNPNAKRRTPRNKPPEPPEPSKPAIVVPSKATATKPSNSSDTAKTSTTASAAPSKPTTTAPLKREKSDLFKSFAKAAAQPKKPKPTPPSASKPASGAHALPPAAATSAPQDADMEDLSADDSDGTHEAAAQQKRTTTQATAKARSEREEKLRKMMEEDDSDTSPTAAPHAQEPEDEEPSPTAPTDEDGDTAMDDTGALDTPKPDDEKKEEVITVNGRRRGRRRIMKKRTFKDEDGYFVTKEEPAWESFSEEEPVPKKAKPTPAPPPAKKGAKGKPPAKGGIMGYFGKK